MRNRINRRYPRYPDDSDYNTNAPSYYDDLARKQKLIELLAKKIWEYEELLDVTLEELEDRLETYIKQNDDVMKDRLEEWNKELEEFPENVELLLQDWLSNGTLDHIINETIFNWKVDQTEFDEFKENTTTQLAHTNQDIIERAINVKSLGAKGDGVTDDTEILQQAIDLGFDEGYPVYVPNGIYIITKPLKVYGNSKKTYQNAGDATVLYGESRGTTKFIKTTNDTINAEDSELNVDTIMLVTNRELDANGTVNNVYLSNISLESGASIPVEYGLYMIASGITASIFEKLYILRANNSIYTVGDNYLNEFRFIRMEFCVNGFDRGSRGIHTSNLYQTMYVQGCSGTAFRISGNYVTALNLHADGVTGTVFNFHGLQGTVISPGSESSNANIMFDFHGPTPDYTACVVVGANTWALNKENGVHIKTSIGTVTFIGGSINRRISDSTVSAGRLIEGNEQFGSLVMDNVKITRPPATPSILPKSSRLDFSDYQTNNATIRKSENAVQAQSLQPSETVEVTYTSTIINNSNLVEENRFKIPEFVRKVRLNASVVFRNSVENAKITIRKNDLDSNYQNLPFEYAKNTQAVNLITPIIDVEPGDEFFVEVTNSGSSEIVINNRAYNYFSIEVIE